MNAVRNLTFTETVQMVTEACCNCGVVFAMTYAFKAEKLKRKGESFFCPNGHDQCYLGESDKDKAARLERELQVAASAKRFAESRLADEQERHKRELKRIEKRSCAGVCLECHRTFSNVARHMKTKHMDCKAEPQP